MGTVFLGAALTTGLVLTDSASPTAVVTGPERLDHWAARAGSTTVLATALLPMGVRFPTEPPTGVHDIGREIWGQPDAFIPWDPPASGDEAVEWAGLTLTQGELWETAATGSLSDGGRLLGDPGLARVLTEANPASPPGLASFTVPLASGGSVVLVAGAGPDRLEAIAISEQVTDRFPRPVDQG
jgi:uncharacterized protein (TIGR03089 family)